MEILIALLCIIGQIWIISDLPLAVKDKNKWGCNLNCVKACS